MIGENAQSLYLSDIDFIFFFIFFTYVSPLDKKVHQLLIKMF